ncbi:MAG: helix-turn-helix domain-containing protein [Candidatus Binatus sp.]
MNSEITETAQFLSLPKAAHVIGVDVRRIRDAVERGQVRAVRIGSRLMIPRKAIERLVEGH